MTLNFHIKNIENAHLYAHADIIFKATISRVRLLFFQKIVDYVDYRCSISRYGSQVGLIEFSSPRQTHVEFSLRDNTSHWSVDNAIDRVGYDSGKVRFL